MAHLQDLLPLSGASEVIWATALEVDIARHQRPSLPSFLSLTVCVNDGLAGVGWYDNDGLAEEIFVNRSPDQQKIFLTVWQPQGCVRLIIRNARNENLAVELKDIEWLPINDSTLTRDVFATINRSSDGFFLDQELKGQFGESLWRDWQENRFDRAKKYQALTSLVQIAWQQCPGYRDFWTSHGWHPSYLRRLEDVHDIPVISKDVIRANIVEFTAVDNGPFYEFATAGSTGAPFSFKYTPLLNAAHLSAVAIAASYGDPLIPPWKQKALIIKRSVKGPSATGAGGSLIINAASLHDASLMQRLVQSYQPTLLFGWPSYTANFVEALRGQYEFRLAILGSENVFDDQVAETESIAKGVVGTYGLSEGAGFAMRCRDCGTYTELDTHGIISLQPRADGLFDIVGTSFWSRGTLFIRYANGDITFGPANACPKCPHSMLHFKRPSGRNQEFLVDAQGARHALGMVVGAERIVALIRGIELFDFVQTVPGNLLFRYVTRNRNVIDEGTLIDQLKKILGDKFVVRCRYDERILDLKKERQRSSAQKWTILKPTDFES